MCECAQQMIEIHICMNTIVHSKFSGNEEKENFDRQKQTDNKLYLCVFFLFALMGNYEIWSFFIRFGIVFSFSVYDETFQSRKETNKETKQRNQLCPPSIMRSSDVFDSQASARVRANFWECYRLFVEPQNTNHSKQASKQDRRENQQSTFVFVCFVSFFEFVSTTRL